MPNDDSRHDRASRLITWEQFTAVELRAGTIVRVDDFPEARKPAYRITVDFGPEIGTLRTSAQVTVRYGKEELVGRQVVGVVNFPVKQIGPMRSEFLLTGFPDAEGAIVIATTERRVPDGAKLC